MRVLCHGVPFCCDWVPLDRYEGPHDIRSLGYGPPAHYVYDPRAETLDGILARIRREWDPELLLCWTPEIYPPPLGVEHSPIPTAALVSDWNLFHAMLAVNLTRYDTALCDKPGVAALGRDGAAPCHFFPLYSQVTTVHRELGLDRDIDVAFAGNLAAAAHPDRARYLERLALLADRYRVAVARDLAPEDYARLLNRARIVFNHSIRGELNLRVFETMACGALAFLEESNAEVRDWFADGRDIVLYNERNFEERLHYYLGHEAEARAVAARGAARAQAFAGERRFTELIDRLAARPTGGRRFLELPPVEQRYQTLLMVAFSRWPALHEMEERLLAELARDMADDPRFWVRFAQHLINPYSLPGTEEERRQRALKALAQARRLAADRPVHALNLAGLFRLCGADQQEHDQLMAALDGDSLEGAELVMGNFRSAFWVRWHRAVAEGTAHVGMLRAEARIRLAALTARHGAPDLAESHLAHAYALDPGNAGGARMHAELLWNAGRRDEAVALIESRLPDLPCDAGARRRLGEMLRDTGRAAEAAEREAQAALFDRVFRPDAAQGL